jgi:alginate O-acetyltransferase complex protein AlgI
MNFVSWQFLFFLAAFFCFFFLTPKKYQWLVILVANVVFYICAGWKYALFLLFTMVTTYLCALWIGQRNVKRDKRLEQGFSTREEKQRFNHRVDIANHWICALGVVLNIGVLFTLKYVNFFGSAIFGWLGKSDQFQPMDFLLPIGISFYTFSSLGYLIDVYREMLPAEKNPLKFVAVISFFPVVLQGPICSYGDLSRQIIAGFEFSPSAAWAGFKRMVLGYLKKIVIADLIGIAVGTIWNNQTDETGFVFFLGVFLYAIQLYADFSGYMDISLGICTAIGIKLPENFELPYLSHSISEFWRLWHITLGVWFRNYLYYPLMRSNGFGRLKKLLAKKSRNFAEKTITVLSLIVVWVSIGLWHGANLTYLLYGCYHGFFVILDVVFGDLFQKVDKKLHINPKNPFWQAFQYLRTFVLVCFGYYLFRSPSVTVAFEMAKSGLKFWDWSSIIGADLGLVWWTYLLVAGAIALCYFANSFFREESIAKANMPKWNLSKMKFPFQFCLLILVCASVITVYIYEMSLGDFSSNFIYFNF